MDPTTFTVATLREVSKSLGLPTVGNKAELIRRLQDSDPSDAWMQEAELVQNDESRSTTGKKTSSSDDNMQPNPGANEAREKELELIRREHELTRRELELTRRELELLRGATASPIVQQPPSYPNVHALKDLLSEFEGSGDDYRRWRDQLQILMTTYKLDDEI